MRSRHEYRRSRRGLALVEASFVLPVVMTLILGTIVTGLGVFRSNQLAYLAREGARWASVRGPKYQEEQKVSAPTAATVLANAVAPRMSGLDPAELTATLTWDNAASPPTVTFRLDYRWVPEAIVPTTGTFTSISSHLVTY